MDFLNRRNAFYDSLTYFRSTYHFHKGRALQLCEISQSTERDIQLISAQQAKILFNQQLQLANHFGIRFQNMVINSETTN